jgi:hypothetical protein
MQLDSRSPGNSRSLQISTLGPLGLGPVDASCWAMKRRRLWDILCEIPDAIACALGAIDTVVFVCQSVGWTLRVAIVIVVALLWCWSHVGAIGWHALHPPGIGSRPWAGLHKPPGRR